MALSILVVDDDEDLRDLLERFLKKRGYIVNHAEDGEEALAAAEEDEPDIVLLDIYLPKMSGLEVLSEMRRRGIHSRTIALSGIPDDQMVDDSLRLGAVDFIAKPLDFAYLEQRIEEIALAP